MGSLFLLASILYANTLLHGFVLDDAAVITENPFTTRGLAGVPDLLTHDMFEGILGKPADLSGGRYRPLSLLTFALEYELFGDSPLPGHIGNVVLYGLTSVLLFLVLTRWFGRHSLIPFAAALLFVVHPIHTEVVANIKSRDEILCLFLLLLALLGLDRCNSAKSRKVWWGLFGVSAYLLSLLAKETAITFLAVIPFVWFLFYDKNMRASVVRTVPFLAVALLYLAWRTAVVGVVGADESVDLLNNPYARSDLVGKFATISVILLQYLRLLLFPHPLSSDYSYNAIPLVSFADPLSLVGAAAYGGMGIYLALKIWKRDVCAFAVLVYLASLSVASNIVVNIGAPMGERFLFIPSVGFVILAAYLLTGIFRLSTVREVFNNRKAVPALLIFSVICLAFSAKTIARNAAWSDNMTLFSADIRTVPGSAKMQYYLGNTYWVAYVAGKPRSPDPSLMRRAKSHFYAGYSIYNDYVDCTYNLGQVYEEEGKADSALAFLNRTLELRRDDTKSMNVMGKVYGRLLNDPDTALRYLEKSRDLGDPDYVNLGISYAMKRRFAEAVAAFEKALEEDPNDARIYQNLGVVYGEAGDPQKSQEMFRRAEALTLGQ
jgi:tetratricopeptide (TPR) repeat protein